MSKEENVFAEIKNTLGQRDKEMETAENKEKEFEILDSVYDSWKVYRVACQIRFGYFSFLIMLSVLLFSFTMLMELFFAVFLPSARSDPHFYVRAILFLCFLPFAIIFLSWIFEESVRFFLDCLGKRGGGLFKIRLHLVAFIHYYRRLKYAPDLPTTPQGLNNEELLKTRYPPVDYTTFTIVGFVIPFVFELVTITAFLIVSIAHLSVSKGFSAYITVGFYTTMAYLLFWIVLHFWTNKNGTMAAFITSYILKERERDNDYREVAKRHAVKERGLEVVGFRTARSLSHWIHRITKNVSCQCCSRDSEENIALPDADSIQEDPKRTATQPKVTFTNPWINLRFTYRILILIPLTVGAAVLSFVAFYPGWLLMGLLLIIIADAMRKRYHRVFGTTFRTFVVTFVILSLLFFSSTWWIGTFVIGGDFKVYPPTANTTVVQPNAHWANLPAYPICDFNYSGLDIIDMVLIADAAYGSNTSIQKNSLAERFNGTEFQNVVYVNRSTDADSMTWMELYFPGPDKTVIAIRGTASATDALEDMHYWFGIGLFQTVNIFFPFLSQLPQDFVVKMIQFTSLQAIMPEPIYMKLLRHAKSVRDRVGEDNVMIVGHSLGGAMAGMVASKLRIPAVSFSGPGLLYTRGRFGIQDADIRHFVITIKPMKDVVPKVDMLGGLVQQIDCRKSNALQCHSTTTHACELYYACGDAKNRDWSQAKECQNFIKEDVSAKDQILDIGNDDA